MTPSNPTTSKRLSLISVERAHAPFRSEHVNHNHTREEQSWNITWPAGAHFVRLFWDVRGRSWPHPPPPLANYPLSWIHPRGWSRRACWVCWGQLCPPETCCRGPRVSRNTGQSKATGRLPRGNPKKSKADVTWTKKTTPLSPDLNHETILQLFAGGKEGLRGGKLKIPKFVLHSEMSSRK